MGSIRARLTAAYAAAFIGMLVIFSIALLAVRRELLFRELEARVGELRAALRAAEDKLDGVARV